MMTVENWIAVGQLVVDLLKSIIPFGALIFIILYFKEEIRKLIKSGGLKVTAPGFSLEALENQQIKQDSKKEKKEIEGLNKELKTTKLQNEKLLELQKYTTRDKDTFFLGYHFEKTYRVLFPSQMVILNIMSNNNNEINEALAMSLFRRTIWSQQLNVPYEQFMGFLEHSGLIIYNRADNKYTLAPLGVTFLRYLNENKIPFKIPANDIIIPTTQ